MTKPSRRRALALWARTNSPGSINLASWHSPHSLTWSWILHFSRFRADEWKVWPLFWRLPRHIGGQQRWGLRFPYLGTLSWSRQEPMWYCDIQTSTLMRHLDEVREAYERGRRHGRREVFQGVGRELTQ